VNKLDLGLLSEDKELASKANVIIGVVGDMSCIFDQEMYTSGEGVDRADIELSEPQTKLIEELSSLGKPIIFVVIAERPISLEKIINKVNAVLWTWKLGEEGGNAIADVIFGETSPRGDSRSLCLKILDNHPYIILENLHHLENILSRLLNLYSHSDMV